MKKSIFLIVVMLGLEGIQAQSIHNFEHGILGYERKLSDALVGNELSAHAAYAEHLLLGFHVENNYSIRQASSGSVGIIIPQKNSAVAMSASIDGTSFFRNWKINVGGALRLQNNISIGLKLIALGTQIKNEKSMLAIGYQMGMSYKLSQATHCHFHFTNTRPLNTNIDYNLQGIYQIRGGIAQQINQDVLVSCEINQEKSSYIYISPGLLWKIKNKIQLLAGLKTGAGEAYMGIGWLKNNNRMMIVIRHHPYLGNSFGFRYNIEKD